MECQLGGYRGEGSATALTAGSHRARAIVENLIYVDGSRSTFEGIEAIAAEMSSQFAVIANTKMEIVATVFQGPTGFVERIERHEIGGKPLAVEVVGVFEVDNDGRIKRWRDYYDLKSVSAQMKAAGIIVPPR